MKTLKQYERVLLEQIFPRYIRKSGYEEGPQEILNQIRMECHNPFFMCCVILDGAGVVIGFFVAFVQMTNLGKRMYVDHVYTPDTGQSAQVFDMVRKKLGVEDVIFMTRRNPEAWIKLFNKYGIKVKLHGYLIRTVQDMGQFGQEKED